jgi:hypothetical protein
LFSKIRYSPAVGIPAIIELFQGSLLLMTLGTDLHSRVVRFKCSSSITVKAIVVAVVPSIGTHASHYGLHLCLTLFNTSRSTRTVRMIVGPKEMENSKWGHAQNEKWPVCLALGAKICSMVPTLPPQA